MPRPLRIGGRLAEPHQYRIGPSMAGPWQQDGNFPPSRVEMSDALGKRRAFARSGGEVGKSPDPRETGYAARWLPHVEQCEKGRHTRLVEGGVGTLGGSLVGGVRAGSPDLWTRKLRQTSGKPLGPRVLILVSPATLWWSSQ